MDESIVKIMQGMVSILNEASDAYYNTGNPIMSDEQFDARLGDLQELEKETGFVLSNSPTHNVGYKVLAELQEIEHSHPMLSLEKCHSVDDIIKFSNGKELVASIKLDGLSVSLEYQDGFLVKGETRGNGYVGSDITEHVKQFQNVPLKINKQGTYVIDGEAIINDFDFKEINKNGEYKNSRNLASGTLSSLDTKLVAQRKLRFFAWDVIRDDDNTSSSNNMVNNLEQAQELGFDVVPYWFVKDMDVKVKTENLQNTIEYIFDYAKDDGLPCDGVVFKYNDIEYGKSLGKTEHHFKNGIAYKASDEATKTTLTDIEWTCGKHGNLTPVAIFYPVELDGTRVERASVHNVSILTKLDLHIGDVIEVVKSNKIIPQVKRNVSADNREALGIESDYIAIPSYCPICGRPTEIKQDNDSKVLVCTYDDCQGKLLGKLTHFVSKNAMNIDGLSEATLEKFIDLDFIDSFIDIYELKNNFDKDIEILPGFGKKSANKLFDAIEKSKTTTLDRFIYSLSIPLIGRAVSKDIAKYCNGDVNIFLKELSLSYGGRNFTDIDGFGEEMYSSIHSWWDRNKDMTLELIEYLTFIKPSDNGNSDILKRKTFVITGSLNHFNNRDELKEKIESLGGKVSGSVSSKTSYLLSNDVNSNSSKNKKAKDLGIPIMTEDEFLKMIKQGG